MDIPIKLTTIEQLHQLKEGDLLQKFPTKGKQEKAFDKKRKTEIDTYEIKAVNRKHQKIRLLLKDQPTGIFSWPDDEEKFYIDWLSVLSEGKWWVKDMIDIRPDVLKTQQV